MDEDHEPRRRVMDAAFGADGEPHMLVTEQERTRSFIKQIKNPDGKPLKPLELQTLLAVIEHNISRGNYHLAQRAIEAARVESLKRKDTLPFDQACAQPVGWLGLTVRTEAILTSAGIVYVRNIMEMSGTDLFGIRGIGQNVAEEIVNCLANKGLNHRDMGRLR